MAFGDVVGRAYHSGTVDIDGQIEIFLAQSGPQIHEVIEFFRVEIAGRRFGPVVNPVFELMNAYGVESLPGDSFSHGVGLLVGWHGHILREIGAVQSDFAIGIALGGEMAVLGDNQCAVSVRGDAVESGKSMTEFLMN